MHYKFLAVAMASVVASTAYAGELPDKIVGLEQAKHFKSQSSMNYFVQTGSFSNKSNAFRYQTYLHSKLGQKVTVRQKGNYHVVLVGPLTNAQQVREVALAVSSNSSADKVQSKQTNKPAQPKTKKILFPAEQTVSTVDKDGFLEPPRNLAGFFIGLDGGIAWARNHTMFVNNGSGLLPPLDLDTYTINGHNFYFIGALAGYKWENSDTLLPMLSIAARYRHLFHRNIGGVILENSLREFTNYDYYLQTDSNTVMAVGKLSIVRCKNVLPYLSGGVGIAFNRFAGYYELPKPDVTPRVSPGFGTHTQKEFTYSLGAGFDIELNPALTVSIGYEFQDFGQFNTDFGVGTWSSQQLSQNAFRTNSLLLGIDYLFNG